MTKIRKKRKTWTECEDAKMRELFALGYKNKDIATKVGVSLNCITRHLAMSGLYKTPDMISKSHRPVKTLPKPTSGDEWKVHPDWMNPSRLITPVMPRQYHFKKGEEAILKLVVQGGNIDRKMVYLGEVKGKNRMHLFRSIHGGYKESFTDMQIAEVIRR